MRYEETEKEIIDDLLSKLQLLNEPYRSKAIDNTFIDRIDVNGYMYSDKRLSDAVLYAFEWEETEEGSDFWDKYHDTLTELTDPD